MEKVMALFAFAEFVSYQRQQGSHGWLFLFAIRFNFNFTANASGQHHDAHDAFCIDASLAFAEPHLAWKSTSDFGQFGRSPGMKA
jgi:hypothetical protein